MNAKTMEVDFMGFGLILVLAGWLSFNSFFGTILFYVISIPLMLIGLALICLSFETEKIVRWIGKVK